MLGFASFTKFAAADSMLENKYPLNDLGGPHPQIKKYCTAWPPWGAGWIPSGETDRQTVRPMPLVHRDWCQICRQSRCGMQNDISSHRRYLVMTPFVHSFNRSAYPFYPSKQTHFFSFGLLLLVASLLEEESSFEIYSQLDCSIFFKLLWYGREGKWTLFLIQILYVVKKKNNWISS